VSVGGCLMVRFLLFLAVSLSIVGGTIFFSNRPLVGQVVDSRVKAQAALKNGNYKDAYADFSALALNAADDAGQVSDDYKNALTCLQNLGTVDEIDDFREKVITAHGKNWRLLFTAAKSYLDIEHNGYLIVGKFSRGYHRGGGKYVNSYERDRVRAMQLMTSASELMTNAKGKEAGDFYLFYADTLMNGRNGMDAWLFQSLTDITTLPDYDEGYYYRYYRGGNGDRGAPVDEAGNPVVYKTPGNWDGSKNDGERWRWLLKAAADSDAVSAHAALFKFASFAYSQFDVRTMASYSWFTRMGDDENTTTKSKYSLVTLTDNETIAKLATGVKKFNLPDEYNYIKLFNSLADSNGEYKDNALRMLANIYMDRRQFDRAIPFYKKLGDDKAIKQITGNWGALEPAGTQPYAKNAEVDFRFRNGNLVHLTANAINVQQLLTDVKAYIKTKPAQLDWNKMQIDNIGYQLVNRNLSQYVGAAVANWDMNLTPRAGHFDRRITIKTPLNKAGAYLLTANMADGSTSRIIIWVADTAIVTKQMENSTYLFVADAADGKAVPNATVSYFGYYNRWINEPKTGAGRTETLVQEKEFTTDENGQLIVPAGELENNYTWITTARKDDRFAYMGFRGYWWGGRQYDQQYEQVKAFFITDRPVYRPEGSVKFKVWVNTAKYDQQGNSPFAGQNMNIRIWNPRNEKVLDKNFTADNYGGIAGEMPLTADAVLGTYRISVNEDKGVWYNQGTFRIEEYKKPEFEVTVESPKDPIMLGETATAKIKAKYYFGAPVTEAKVKYKVTRSDYNKSWYPVYYWDWMYGNGYCWYSYDYYWYPGWRDWGCKRPIYSWWQGWRPQPQPEIVAEAEVPIGPDGTVDVTIDTALAKEMQGDTDHKYEISAEVTDQSRRTITGGGQVLATRKPFKVYAWVDRGYYRVGDPIMADFSAQTLDNKPVKGAGVVKVMKVSYKAGTPIETPIFTQALDTNDEGKSTVQLKAGVGGQYRISYTVTDGKGRSIEGGYLFTVRGEGASPAGFRFNDVELIPDKREYNPGENVNLMINADIPDTNVMLFIRPTNGVYKQPQMIKMVGKTSIQSVAVAQKDMPNFFVEVVTVGRGKVFTEVREIAVPPVKKSLDVQVLPSAEKYKPGESATVKLKVTDPNGKPVQGQAVVSVYDKAVEYISGGSNVPDIREFFWKWRRYHSAQTGDSLSHFEYALYKDYQEQMQQLGIFGNTADEEDESKSDGDMLSAKTETSQMRGVNRKEASFGAANGMPMAAAPGVAMDSIMEKGAMADGKDKKAIGGGGGNAPAPGAGNGGDVEPTVRTEFADTAFWTGAVETGADGTAQVTFKMPENLTGWKMKSWVMGAGTAVGEGEAAAVTVKNLLLRMQAPRFFTQKDEVVLSANIHNYLTTTKKVKAVLELDGPTLVPLDPKTGKVVTGISGKKTVIDYIEIPANGEKRVDFRVLAVQPGQAIVRMKAITDEESDAMEMKFPVQIHGMLKTESYSGVIRPNAKEGAITVTVPAERLPEQSRLEVRWSPTLAGAMVDALPYMADYPYGCTEQTLNKFLPTLTTQKILKGMGLNLKDIEAKRTNLNAQEIGNDVERAKGWKRFDTNPVFDEAEVANMVTAGINRLASMQCSDGGWGWFSGYGEQSYAHTTAVVVHGLQRAKAIGTNLPANMLERGVTRLQQFQNEELGRLKLWRAGTHEWPAKEKADAMDAFIYMVLADATLDNREMRQYLYEDRLSLPVYAKCMFGIALHTVGDIEKRDMLIKNIDQYLVEDNENQTAYLKLPNDNYWWYWYGSEYEAQAYYLKLLTLTDPKGTKASGMVKYLLNNRKHATYWNSTRDTSYVVEAFADYMKASGEDKPDMNLQVFIDNRLVKTVQINAGNLFTFDNKLVLEGADLTTGAHEVKMVKTGTGPLYFNAYMTNFTLEDNITKAGLEIKVNRKYYKLLRVDKTVAGQGSRGQVLGQKVEKYERVLIDSGASLKSGDLVEVELEIDSKNDYEYILFEDMKPAGFETVEVRSGYTGNEMGAYVEFRDNRVALFVRSLARGKHSMSYRVRAEIPGKFSALPTMASAMYAPELKANSDEWKIGIKD